MVHGMEHGQIPAEPSTFLEQARDFLDRARRLKPGPARNELREVAKVLRELAKLEEQPEFAPSRAARAARSGHNDPHFRCSDAALTSAMVASCGWGPAPARDPADNSSS